MKSFFSIITKLTIINLQLAPAVDFVRLSNCLVLVVLNNKLNHLAVLYLVLLFETRQGFGRFLICNCQLTNAILLIKKR